eukprot:365431-Chlamydomonas_euryale.AAC.32
MKAPRQLCPDSADCHLTKSIQRQHETPISTQHRHENAPCAWLQTPSPGHCLQLVLRNPLNDLGVAEICTC